MKKTQQHQTIHNFFILVEGMVIFTILFLGIVIYANWDAFRNEIDFAVKSVTPTPTPIVTTPATPTPTPSPVAINEPAHLVIEKIGVDTPLQWDIPVEVTIEALNHGVAHLQGSARLGEIGNLFITGHSSDYVWKKNPYAAVFSLLPKLQIGDTLTIKENGKTYIYRVAETKIVNPDQVEVAAPTTTPVVTLMTCYPVGTTRQRFIVHAQLISSPEKPLPIETGAPTTLPEIKFR